MLTVIFASLGSFIDEISSSIIKYETDHKKESVYTAGFINTLFAALILIAVALARGSFVFSLLSLPTFIARAVLEIFQSHMTMMAVMKADRSSFVFVRNLTIPILLIVNLFLGFTVNVSQWIGIAIVFAVLIIILLTHLINFRGIGYSLFIAVNAVITISLFKFNVTYFNSVEAEQIVMSAILLSYFFFSARLFARENPFSFLKCKLFLTQGVAHGVASILQAFAISFGVPGIAITAERAAAVFAGIISGRNYFQEKKFGAKFLVSLGLIVGLLLLTR